MSPCIHAHEVFRNGHYHESGYWMMHNREKRRIDYAHRMVYVETIGDPDGPVIRHSCDNRQCVNPEHLLSGTMADNSRDMVVRGRSTAQLKADQVEVVRLLLERGWASARIARATSISVHIIKDIKRKRSYNHV